MRDLETWDYEKDDDEWAYLVFTKPGEKNDDPDGSGENVGHGWVKALEMR